MRFSTGPHALSRSLRRSVFFSCLFINDVKRHGTIICKCCKYQCKCLLREVRVISLRWAIVEYIRYALMYVSFEMWFSSWVMLMWTPLCVFYIHRDIYIRAWIYIRRTWHVVFVGQKVWANIRRFGDRSLAHKALPIPSKCTSTFMWITSDIQDFV